jgi:hypothetical protein
MGFSQISNDMVFYILALNGSMSKTFFWLWLMAAGCWLLVFGFRITAFKSYLCMLFAI